VDRACLGRPIKVAFLALAAVETAAGPDDDYYNCTAIAVRKLDDGTSDARSFAAAVVGICRKYRIEWLLTLTKDGNRETAIHVRPNEAREPSTGLDRRENASWRPNEHVLA
jgi:hypothetical protein